MQSWGKLQNNKLENEARLVKRNSLLRIDDFLYVRIFSFKQFQTVSLAHDNILSTVKNNTENCAIRHLKLQKRSFPVWQGIRKTASFTIIHYFIFYTLSSSPTWRWRWWWGLFLFSLHQDQIDCRSQLPASCWQRR